MIYAYYRSDTRVPSQIFHKGFSAKFDQASSDKRGLVAAFSDTKPRGDSLNFFPQNIIYGAQDVIGKQVICTTRKFESAAMFPVKFCRYSYIYVMLLPPAIPLQLQYGPAYGQSPIPEFSPNVVFDTHSLQTQQAHCIADICHKNTFSYDPKNIAWSLNAYECMSTRITPDRIMAAVLIERRAMPEHFKTHGRSIDGKIQRSFEVEFKVVKFDLNPNAVITDSKLYSSTMKDIRDHWIQEKWLRIPSFAYSLGGTLLPAPSRRPAWINIENPGVSPMNDLVGEAIID